MLIGIKERFMNDIYYKIIAQMRQYIDTGIVMWFLISGSSRVLMVELHVVMSVGHVERRPAGTGRPRCSGWRGARCGTAVETVGVVGDSRARHGTGSSSKE